MNHLTEEQLVLHHYHDDDAPAAVEQHIGACAECRREYDELRRVLSLVDEFPIPERGADYGDRVWNRLRWRLGSRRRTAWKSMLAIAAVLALAFFAGQLWHARNARVATPIASSRPAVTPVATAASPDAPQRVLVFVVGDHLESSERVLAEVANADAKGGLDLNDERERAAQLVVNNRMYRQTATKHGDARIASLLADLEPILVELSHADKLSAGELKSLQKRIDSKGLLFKVRLVSAETSGGATPAAPQKGTNSL